MDLARASGLARSSAALLLDACERDVVGIALPRTEVQLVARFGPHLPRGVEVHALGIRQTVKRKRLRRGDAAALARLPLGTARALFGVPAAALAGQHVAIEDLWGSDAAQRLHHRLLEARGIAAATRALETAVEERAPRASDARVRLVHRAAQTLSCGSVRDACAELGIGERQLRRLFAEIVGVSPKELSRLNRFRRALEAARAHREPHWASIAVDAGYYDQAHMISEFHGIAAATPRALLQELASAHLLG